MTRSPSARPSRSAAPRGGGIVVNGAFRGQAVTGQQRYAAELAAALQRAAPERVRERSLPARIAGLRGGAWAWAQLVGVGRRRGEWLLTLTSRGPLAARRHAVVVHDLFVLEHPEWYTRLYAVTHQVALRMQLRTARHLLAVSEPVAAAVRRAVRDRVPVTVVPNAPAAVFTREPDPEFARSVLERHGLTAGRFLLTVGNDEPRKNRAVLARAWSRLPAAVRDTVPLVLVGGRNDRVFARQEDAAGARVLQGVGDEELAVLYRESLAVLFPSLDEGFGLPAVEALASGAALLASDIPVLRWVCGPHAEYLPATDDAAWAAAMTRLAAAPERDAARREEAARTVLSRFSWDAGAAAVLGALGGARRRRP